MKLRIKDKVNQEHICKLMESRFLAVVIRYISVIGVQFFLIF